jgi:uncharacterized protein YbaR (Trm112 family)
MAEIGVSMLDIRTDLQSPVCFPSSPIKDSLPLKSRLTKHRIKYQSIRAHSDRMSESDFLCEPCKENFRISAEVPLSLVRNVEDGILIADLGKSEVRIIRPVARLCPFTSQ